MTATTRAAAQTAADLIKNETVANANTAQRVGGTIRDLTDSVFSGETVANYGADVDGPGDSSTAITSMETALGYVRFPAGVTRIGTNVTLGATTKVYFDPGASVVISTGVTFTHQVPDASPAQTIYAFEGSGAVVFNGGDGFVYSAWFGSATLAEAAAAAAGLKLYEFLSNSSNQIRNGNFAVWQRFDVNALTSIDYVAPTPGDSATFDGTGGVRVYGPDMWHGKMYGLVGSGTLTRVAMTPALTEQLPTLSEWHLNWTGDGTVPPAATETTITAATDPTSDPVTITAPGHGLSNGDYVNIYGSTYSGGVGTLDNGTATASLDVPYLVSNVSGDDFDITITPDASFTAWTDFGTLTNDPFQHANEHLYETSISRWVRNGTAGHELTYRVPLGRLAGSITVRIVGRLNSGNGNFIPRAYVDYGSGGSPTATSSNNLPGFVWTGGIETYEGTITLPDITGDAYGSTSKTSYLQLTIASLDPTVDHDIDIFSVSLHFGGGRKTLDHKDYASELPFLRQFYRAVTVGLTNPVTTGRYYGTIAQLDPPMYGAPTITKVSDLTLTFMNAPTSDQITTEGFRAIWQCNTTDNVGIARSRFEAVYEIPS